MKLGMLLVLIGGILIGFGVRGILDLGKEELNQILIVSVYDTDLKGEQLVARKYFYSKWPDLGNGQTGDQGLFKYDIKMQVYNEPRP